MNTIGFEETSATILRYDVLPAQSALTFYLTRQRRTCLQASFSPHHLSCFEKMSRYAGTVVLPLILQDLIVSSSLFPLW